ncbi:MAG: acyl-CoA thioesterase/bile acid-CoA:amino acid N-acyltransferase family protein [Methanobacterium sp.]
MQLIIKKGENDTNPSSKTLLGDEIFIKALDLPEKTEIKLHARKYDKNNLWYSFATFMSDGEGVVNTAKSPAISGKYNGIDPSGLFWSMEILQDLQILPENLNQLDNSGKILLHFDVEIDNKITTSKTIEVLKILQHVKIEKIEEENIIGNFYYSSKKNDLPAVLIVSGSEGGISTPDIIAGVLASHGYAALALAYFDMPGLSPILEEIPIEYVEKAIKWLKKHQTVDNERLAMMGTSKGAELTLLSASMFPDIKAVIAASPSYVVFQSSNPDPKVQPKSSWTYKGNPMPFIPFIITEEFYKQFESGFPQHLEYLPLYKASIKGKDAVEKATINIENINGPVLLISGSDDKVWPSKEMSEKIMERFKKFKFPHDYQHLNYEGAGHVVARPGYTPWPTPYYVKGGSPDKNGQLQVDIWNNVLKFLAENL